MATLSEVVEWTTGIYQLETSDPVLGGPEGIDNLQAKQLANRTSYLKQHVDALETGSMAAGKASTLATARLISVTGDGAWSVSFNGSGNVSGVLTLSNSGVSAGSYCKVTVNAKGLVTVGGNLVATDIPVLDWSKITTGKPTTLGGYGISDALGKAGGDVTGNIRMLEARSIELVASATPSWAGGLHATKNAAGGGDLLGGFGAWGSNNALNCLYMGLGTTPWGSGNGVRVLSSGVTIEGILSGNGSGLTSVPFASLTGTPNTLTGYGIAVASQAEAEAGADTNKPMTALRVFQAIAAKVVQATASSMGIARIATQLEVNSGTDDATIVTPKKFFAGIGALIVQATTSVPGIARIAMQSEVNAGIDDTTIVTPKKFFAGIGALIVQATETVAGVARIATQGQADAGTDDTTVITPKKLRWGFQMLKAQQGYLVLPSWLGSFIVQWGYATTPATSSVIPFTLSYPAACLSITAMPINASTGSDSVELTGLPTKTGFPVVVVSSGASGSASQVAASFFWISIGC